MKENLTLLLNLQEIDTEIDVLRRSQDDYPTEIAELQGELDRAKHRLDAKVQKEGGLEKNQRLMEQELEALNLDLKKHQDRLYEVKSNKEYDALQHEIEALRGRVEETETAILETIEAADALKEKLKDERQLFKDLENEKQERITSLQSQLDSLDEDVRGREEKRDGLASQIDKKPLSIYTRIRRVVKGGVAAVSLEKGSCGGCFRRMPPQRMVEIRRRDQVIRCENCGRLLVWREEVSA